jgi:hypothetical protein
MRKRDRQTHEILRFLAVLDEDAEVFFTGDHGPGSPGPLNLVWKGSTETEFTERLVVVPALALPTNPTTEIDTAILGG